MAAYAALLSLVQIIDDIENHHSPPISIDKNQVKSLTEIVTFLQEFLEGYSSPVADDDDKADPLEMRIIDAAYAAEDIIESNIVAVIKLSRSTTIHDQGTTSTTGEKNYSGEESRSGSAEKNDSRKESRSGSGEENYSGEETTSSEENNSDEETTSNSGEEVNSRKEVSCITLYEDLHQVIEEMHLIKKVAMEIDAEKVASASVVSLRSSTGQSNSSMMVCSDDVLLGIMEKLVAGWPDRQVVPIVGMGGIGKTTLARTVYSKPLIKEHFDICGWATISQQYKTRDILYELFCQTTNKKKEELSGRSEDELASELYKYLYGRRFLIVMDDMWSIDAWDEIQRFLPNNENGSRILVTTRLSQLSSQLNNNYSLQMEFLDECSSWDLFSKTVFGEESCPLELMEIGKEIVQNCRGLPLSIVVVGGLLKKMEHTQRCWESIRNNLTSVVNLENDKHCLRLLKLSYNHLPVYLKPCFLYMGVFEEDERIRVSELIKQWVSEGFLKPMNGKSLKTIAKGFLRDLVDRNLILIEKLGNTGNINRCKIHDLVRDLCLRESRKYGFYDAIGQGSRQGINSQRRVVILKNTSEQNVLDVLQSTSHNTRSIICEGEVPWCGNFGLLRTLDVDPNIFIDESYVDELVFQCVNLRHLAVFVGIYSSFFSSVNLLWNLQTLIVDFVFEFTSAPFGIWEMPQFRHIEFENFLHLTDPPSDGRDDIVVMENLHTLKGVNNFKCGEEVVKRIPNVKKLLIKYYDRDDDYCLSNIKCLCKLESLLIDCRFMEFIASMHKLTFPQSLKSLTLKMKKEFEWEEVLEKIGWLPLLEKLRLWEGCFRRGEWEIVEGQFPSLKYLELFLCGDLKKWTAQESSIFRHLHLYGLEELKEIPFEIGNIPTLRKIQMGSCSKSAVMSAKDIVDEQVELQGEQLPFHVMVEDRWNYNELQSLAGPNFKVDR